MTIGQKIIYGYPNYTVSEHGVVQNLKTGHLLKNQSNNGGYTYVVLYQDSQRKCCLIHRLVLSTFIGPPPFDEAQVDHIDCNKSNNHYSNLEWVTPKENIRRAEYNKLRPKAVGEQHGRCKVTKETVLEIRKLWQNQISLSNIKKTLNLEICKQQIHRIAKRERWQHVN